MTTLTSTSLQHALDTSTTGVDAEFGVFLRHVESGAEAVLNPDELYPLASVVKVPILLEALAQVDEGRLDLHARVPLTPEVKVLPSGVLVTLEPGLQPTLHDLLTLMIIISDNTATDMVLQTVGLSAVEDRMRTLGLAAIHVTLSIGDLFRHAFTPPDVSLLPVEIDRALAAAGTDWDGLTTQRTPANNTASPRAMAQLLTRLLAGDLLSPSMTTVALAILQRQQLNDRLPRFLPGPIAVAHKTGTFLTTRNDVGIIYLPDGTHLVAAAFALGRRSYLESDPQVRRRYVDTVDTTMGAIGRAAFDTCQDR